MKKYDKLVRDNIPKIIKKSNKTPITRKATDEEFIEKLKEKVLEEANELMKATNQGHELEEIIDIMEAINAYFKHKDIKAKDIERARKLKIRHNGAFKKRVILERVE